MSTVVKKTIHFKINGKDVSAPEGTVIIEAAKQNGFEITNLCYNRKLKPFAACRTCMVDVRSADGKKELVYSCTHPVAEGTEVTIHTEETDRYNGACLEMLLVEHPLDCPICDKSGVCPLQDNTEAMQLHNGRFEIQRRNEPSDKSNPLIEFYLNRCILCGLCVRACDEIQGVQALDFHKRGMKSMIGTANQEPLDCEFCGQCITVCPTGALMDMSSEVRGLAALFKRNHTTCGYCSWGCTAQMETKKGRVVRFVADEGQNIGINEGNLCAKGRFGHGIIHNENRIQTPLMNFGGNFKEVSWEEALKTIADRVQATINRNGPKTVAGIGGEKLTNEENYLFQKLFRGLFGSNQVTNLANLRAPGINPFLARCFENGIESKPVTELDKSDVVLIFNSDLPSEYPVGGNSVRKGAVFAGTDVIIANPRKVVFKSESNIEIRLSYSLGSDAVVVNRICRILIDQKIVDTAKIKSAVPNYEELAQSLAPYTAEAAEKATGLSDETFARAAKRFGRTADRFILVGNDIFDSGQGEEVLNALLNLSILVQHGAEGSVSIFPPREHCNSQGINDMGLTPDFLPGYRPVTDSAALSALAGEWGTGPLKFDGDNPANDLFANCINGTIKFLHIAGEDPVHSYYKGALVKEALNTVPFLVVQDVYMTDTARMADLVLPTTTYAEKEGTFTNMTRHVQRVTPATAPQGQSRTDHDIFVELAKACGKPFSKTTVSEVQDEISRTVPIYKGTLPGTNSKQWVPEGFAQNPRFQIADSPREVKPKEGFPYQLVSNNHMFHIGSYTQYAKALTDVGPDCIAELNPEDARQLNVEDGDRILIESDTHKVEVPVKASPVTAKGMVYVPKNWVAVPLNMLRNGEEGPVSIKISKAD
ncbi:NADH-quinone oxidoreductase, subunit G [Candidatus Nitromaritima sp. SCGC AAA799-A02]|nr:NADH-quinone oxidoreductase, subunit G [Candidatus Nitromaritima sp. SCGC AAA799-C22]KMP11348.1 NADH-quinone oxidoreductase, subunit G [Candidatus Nitromaritima sp. SCGC AAA799-A02]